MPLDVQLWIIRQTLERSWPDPYKGTASSAGITPVTSRVRAGGQATKGGDDEGDEQEGGRGRRPARGGRVLVHPVGAVARRRIRCGHRHRCSAKEPDPGLARGDRRGGRRG